MTPYEANRQVIMNLQRYLRRLAEEENNIAAPPMDGIFDDRTEEALLEFQRMTALEPTGRADRETWDALFAEYQRLSNEQDRSVPIDFFPTSPDPYVTVSGERFAFITLLQFMLGELTLVYDTFDPPEQTGIYDEQTAEAVAEFQRIQRIPVTGLVDRHTWNRLSEEYKNYLT